MNFLLNNQKLFAVFDKDGNGYVSAQEIKHVRNYLDMELTDEEINEMVVEADSNNDAQAKQDYFA